MTSDHSKKPLYEFCPKPALHKENKIPHESTIRKLLSKEMNLVYALDSFSKHQIEHSVRANISAFFKRQKGIFSIKTDEIAITPNARYDCKTNRFLCKPHN